MYNAVNTNLGTLLQKGPIENRCPRCNKAIRFDATARKMTVRPHKHPILKEQRMSRRPSQHRLFHDHTVSPNLDASALSSDHGTGEYCRTFPDADLTTDHRSRCHVGRTSDVWSLVSET